MSTAHEQLPAQTQLLLQKFVNAYNQKWMAILGLTNFLAIVVGLGTIIFWVPNQAANLAARQAEPALASKIDAFLERSKVRIEDAETDLEAMGQQVLNISMQAGRVTGRSESLLEESERLQSSANKLRGILETTDFKAVNEFLTTYSNSEGISDILVRLAGVERRLTEIKPVRVRLHETGRGAVWVQPGSGLTSEGYSEIWGPFEFETAGGELLIHFDSSFTGNRAKNKRSWYRLVVNGEAVRTAMQHSGATWDLGTVAMSTVLSGLGEGVHTISVEAKTQAGGEISAPHHDPDLGDEASRGLIVIELPGA